MTTYIVPINDERSDAIDERIKVGSWVQLFVEGVEHYDGILDRYRIVSRIPYLGITQYGAFAKVVAVDATTLTVEPTAHRLADDEENTSADFDTYVYLSADGVGRIECYIENA